MADEIGEISYIDEAHQGEEELNKLFNFGSDDFDEDELEEIEGDEASGGDSEDGPGVGKTILVTLLLLLGIAAIGGAIWYFALGGADIVARMRSGEAQPEQTEETAPAEGEEPSENTEQASSEREYVDVSASHLTTVDEFLADLKRRGFDTEGLDVEVPYDADGNPYAGAEGIFGVESTDEAISALAANESTSEGAAAETDSENGESKDKAEVSGSESTSETESDGEKSSDAKTTSKKDGFPVLRASFVREDGCEFVVERIDGETKLRVIGDASGRLTKAVSIIESDVVVGYDTIRKQVWTEDADTTSELVYQVRKIDVDTMKNVNLAVARDVIKGVADIADILSASEPAEGEKDAVASGGTTDQTKSEQKATTDEGAQTEESPAPSVSNGPAEDGSTAGANAVTDLD